MKTKIPNYFKLTKTFLIVTLCLALCLPPAGLIWAQSAPAAQPGCPQGTSKDSQRIAHYRQVIRGYLQEVVQLCNNPHPAVREYVVAVAENVLWINYLSKVPELAGLAGDLKTAIDTAKLDFEQKTKDIFAKVKGDLAFGGSSDELGFVQNSLSWYSKTEPGSLKLLRFTTKLWQAQKLSQTIYPQIRNMQTGSYSRNAQDATTYRDELQKMYAHIAPALVVYLRGVAEHYQSELACKPNQKAPDELFARAKQGVKYAYNLSRAITPYAVNYYQKRWQRDDKIYNCYIAFYDELYQAHLKNFSRLPYSTYDGFYRIVDVHRTSWGSYDCVKWYEGKPYPGFPSSYWNSHDFSRHFLANVSTCLYNTKPIDATLLSQVHSFNLLKTPIYNVDKVLSDFTATTGSDCFGLSDEACERKLEALKEAVIQKAKPYLAGYNNFPVEEKAAEDELVQGLNQAEADFPGFPSRQEHALTLNHPNNPVAETILTSAFIATCPGEMPFEPSYYTANRNVEYYIHSSQPVINHPPEVKAEPVAYTGEPVKLGQTVTLQAAGVIQDPDGDSLNYRWVITDIPGESQRYTQYQTIATAESAKFTPDVSGTWQIQLSANDGWQNTDVNIKSRIKENNVQLAAAASGSRKVSLHSQPPAPAAVSGVPVKPQYALVFQHRDADIKLELHTPTIKEFPPKERYRFSGAPYYLEEVEDKVSVREVKNDPKTGAIKLEPANNFQHQDGKIQGRNEDVCFVTTLMASTTASYIGDYGTSDMIHADNLSNSDVYHGTCSSIKFRSSGADRGSCVIEVKVQDKNIDYLVFLDERGCPKPPIPRGSNGELKGTYSIAQCIDRSSWKKNPATGRFEEYPGSNNLPDWLEKRAADVLNASPLLQYISQFSVGYAREDVPALVKNTHPGVIFFNPVKCSDICSRFNTKDFAAYGWTTEDVGGFDHMVLHEAHHMGYFYTIATKNEEGQLRIPNRANDGDGDLLVKPGANDNKIVPVEYLLDSEDNLHGSYGPERDPQTKRFLGTYAGDRAKDEMDEEGKVKVGVYKVIFLNIPIAQINFSQDLTIDLAQFKLVNLPLCRKIKGNYNIEGAPGVTLPQLAMGVRDGNANPHYPPSDPTELEERKKIIAGYYAIPQPKLVMSFPEPQQWQEILKKYPEARLRATVTVQSPEGAMNYDAESQSGAKYNGFWW